jgi:hypothetical protein
MSADGQRSKKLGAHLPQDYKDFIDFYGGGKIAGFISIFSPFSENINLNVINQFSQQSGVLREPRFRPLEG